MSPAGSPFVSPPLALRGRLAALALVLALGSSALFAQEAASGADDAAGGASASQEAGAPEDGGEDEAAEPAHPVREFDPRELVPERERPPDPERIAEAVEGVASGTLDPAWEEARPAVEGDSEADEDDVARRRRRALRDLWRRVQEASVVEVEAPAVRRRVLDRLGSRLEERVAGVFDGDRARERAGEAVRTARADWKEARRIRLEGEIRCWCPKEEWTRRLEACFENCARPQRRAIRVWLDEGLSDQEIRRRMVREAGTEEVLVRPLHPLAGGAPFLIFGAVALVGALLLWRLGRRRDTGGDAPPPVGAGAARSERSDPAAPSPEGGGERSRWEARLDRELEALDDG